MDPPAPLADSSTSSSRDSNSSVAFSLTSSHDSKNDSSHLSEIEIESQDVIRLMLQFCKENNLLHTYRTLQEESQVSLNTVDSIEGFMNDVAMGKWDAVLDAVSHMRIPTSKLVDLYEHVFLEMLEVQEGDTASAILHHVPAMQEMKQAEPERYLRLQHLLQRPVFDSRDAYGDGQSKQGRRVHLANELSSSAFVVAPSRLLTLLGQSLRWQHTHGLVPEGSKIDLFRGQVASGFDEEEKPPAIISHTIQFDEESHPECVVFSPDAQYLVTGSVDGFIEVWDYETGRIRKDLEYQREDNLMMHDSAVLCLEFSRDSEFLVSGSQDGHIKVWKIRTGQCVRRFDGAHSEGVTSVYFDQTDTQILSSSYDNLVRLHGIRSGKMLKEFRGHTSFVNTAQFSGDGSQVISGSADGTVKIWDFKSTECLFTFRPPYMNQQSELSVHSVCLLPKQIDQMLIGVRTNTLYITNSKGKVLRSVSSGKPIGGDFISCSVSPRGDYIYCIGEDSVLYCFRAATGELESIVKLSSKEVIGITLHPSRNLMVSFSDEGVLRVWKPQSTYS